MHVSCRQTDSKTDFLLLNKEKMYQKLLFLQYMTCFVEQMQTLWEKSMGKFIFTG